MPPTQSPRAVRKPSVKRIPVTVRADGARQVVLTGDFTAWAADRLQMTPATNGEWTATLELAPGDYQYRLIVDGEWRDHAESPERIPNPFGSYNSVLKVS